MRQITNSQKLTIYLNTAPFLLGEGFCIGGVLIPVIAFPSIEAFLGLVFLAIGVFIVYRKYQTVKRGTFVLTYGVKSEAVVTDITNTNWKHNKRRVKEYNFQFEANGRKFNHEYRSAFQRHLRAGSKMYIFYIQENPKLVFIPKLYNLNL
ncbi:hypothetical protein LVD17_09170 [Fulvivirga ulvae]|uniref:hypothetical protein n=1 Tax=Fulvivirga ulvae TaxID=2904245 RepID=UPI001F1E6BCB|nr:hypothetical protein [Fulvivirga ulvae]UII33983.1 hypothetical protein LVD17_09170 [Fulvivirga ulvae]